MTVRNSADNKLRHKYGITVSDRALMLDRQGGVCAICGVDAPGGVGWCVDHNHGTGEIRGILCSLCNAGLGAFRDNPDILDAAAAYLE